MKPQKTVFEKIEKGLKEASAIARGEVKPYRITADQELPYPWCVQPQICKDKSSCPRKPSCGS